jgi:putative ABC transport system ATP-binding protein
MRHDRTTLSASKDASKDVSRDVSRDASRGVPRHASKKAAAASARGLSKTYGDGETRVIALDAVDVDFERGGFTAIMGPSGSGKSTLMHCVAGLDTFDAGSVRIGDTELGSLNDKQLTRLRRDKVGFVFQAFNLLPTLTAAENITLPMDIAGRAPDRAWLDTVVGMLGLAGRLAHRPAELSGGQQQRVAVARALASRPEIVFADEPTGNLDSRAGAEVLGFLRDSVREWGQTVVMVTHDPGAAAYADRVVFLADGRIVDAMENPSADAVLDRMKAFDTRADARSDARSHTRAETRPGAHADTRPDTRPDTRAGADTRPDAPRAY